MNTLAALLLALAAMGGQPPPIVHDEHIKVLKFVDAEYPRIGVQGAISGVVVLRATLDDEGRVLQVSAISGPELLIPDSDANVRKWAFAPNPERAVVVVYDYRLTRRGGCPTPQTAFLFRPPNVASVTLCPGLPETSGATGRGNAGTRRQGGQGRQP